MTLSNPKQMEELWQALVHAFLLAPLPNTIEHELYKSPMLRRPDTAILLKVQGNQLLFHLLILNKSLSS